MRVDLHSDLLHKMRREYNYNAESDGYFQSTIPMLMLGGVGMIVQVLFLPHRDRPVEALSHFRSLVDIAGECRPQFDRANIKVCYALENAQILTQVSSLSVMKSLGIRYITLCHKQDNHICGSSDGYARGGLSDYGRDFIAEMNRQGIIVDVSHASKIAMMKAVELSTKPVIASHSNCWTVYPDYRNLQDDQLDAIKANNGMVGFTLLPRCIGARTSIDLFVNHIMHGIETMGIDHVGFGSDYDGGARCIGLETPAKLNDLDAALRAKGLSDEDMNKFWGENFLRVFNENNTTTAS